MLRALRSEATGSRLLRALWLLMLAGHIPALLKCVWAQSSPLSQDRNIVTVVGLLLACVFFVLKILDLPSLRFKTDRRSLFALALAVALVHINLLRYSHDVLADPAQPIVIASILMGTNLASVRETMHRALARFRWPVRLTKLEPRPFGLTVQITDQLTPQCSFFAPIIPRAPPLTA
jgi:hypothetical protein